MIETFKKYNLQNNLFKKEEKVLLALSGGVDSVVLFHLLKSSNINLSTAHCNYQLREEADADEQFCKELCEKHGITFFSKTFNTQEIANREKKSIQMAARDLRYEWFQELSKTKELDKIVVAHHANDNIETFFINLSRGTGLKGLTGMKLESGNIVRPLLPFSKEEILDYAEQNKLEWREDVSNQENKYLRNYLRNQLIPSFKEINPSVEANINNTISYLQGYESIVEEKLQEASEYIETLDNGMKIHASYFLNQSSGKVLLFEILSPFGFKREQMNKIFAALSGTSGKTFFANQHRLIKDRDYLILEKFQNTSNVIVEVLEETTSIEYPNMTFEKVDKQDISYGVDEKIAFLDYEKLNFPLLLRNWEKGDVFIPLGMKNKKKLSDFFIDKKLSIAEKEKTWVLVSNDQIVWVVGHRISDKFKIKETTTKSLKTTIYDFN